MTIDELSIFERPAKWRAAAALGVADNRSERQAAASPGQAFPQALALGERAIEQAPEGPVVDLVRDWPASRIGSFSAPDDLSFQRIRPRQAVSALDASSLVSVDWRSSKSCQRPVLMCDALPTNSPRTYCVMIRRTSSG